MLTFLRKTFFNAISTSFNTSSDERYISFSPKEEPYLVSSKAGIEFPVYPDDEARLKAKQWKEIIFNNILRYSSIDEFQLSTLQNFNDTFELYQKKINHSNTLLRIPSYINTFTKLLLYIIEFKGIKSLFSKTSKGYKLDLLWLNDFERMDGLKIGSIIYLDKHYNVKRLVNKQYGEVYIEVSSKTQVAEETSIMALMCINLESVAYRHLIQSHIWTGVTSYEIMRQLKETSQYDSVSRLLNIHTYQSYLVTLGALNTFLVDSTSGFLKQLGYFTTDGHREFVSYLLSRLDAKEIMNHSLKLSKPYWNIFYNYVRKWLGHHGENDIMIHDKMYRLTDIVTTVIFNCVVTHEMYDTNLVGAVQAIPIRIVTNQHGEYMIPFYAGAPLSSVSGKDSFRLFDAFELIKERFCKHKREIKSVQRLKKSLYLLELEMNEHEITNTHSHLPFPSQLDVSVMS